MSDINTDFTDFDPMDVDLSDLDLEVYENPETGATSYDKPEDESVEDFSDQFVPDEEPMDLGDALENAPEDAVLYRFEDGSQMTKRDAVELAQKRSQLEDEHTYISQLAANLRHSEKHLEAIKQRGLSEVDKQIAAVKDILRDPHLSDTERGQRHRQLQQFEARQAILNDEYQMAQDIIEGEKAELFGKRVRATDEAMTAKYGREWATSAKDVYSYAIGLGASPDELKQVLSPVWADILVKARKWEKFDTAQKQKVKQEVASTVARSKAANSSHTRTESKVSAQNIAAQQKVLSGKASRRDLADACPIF